MIQLSWKGQDGKTPFSETVHQLQLMKDQCKGTILFKILTTIMRMTGDLGRQEVHNLNLEIARPPTETILPSLSLALSIFKMFVKVQKLILSTRI